MLKRIFACLVIFGLAGAPLFGQGALFHSKQTSFPSVPILDTFNRANENPLSDSGKWTCPFDTFNSALKIVSDQAVSAGAGGGDCWWNVKSFGARVQAYVTMATIPTATSGDCADLILRGSGGNTASTNAYFGGFCSASPAVWQICVITNGSFSCTNTANSDATAIANGDKVGMSAVGRVITVYGKHGTNGWKQEYQITDSTFTAAGVIGVELDASGALTNFGGGTQ